MSSQQFPRSGVPPPGHGQAPVPSSAMVPGSQSNQGGSEESCRDADHGPREHPPSGAGSLTFRDEKHGNKRHGREAAPCEGRIRLVTPRSRQAEAAVVRSSPGADQRSHPALRINMANDKDPLKQLKDLASLKNQLEGIQKKVEDEVQAGVPQGGSLLQSPFLKGFVAGYIVSRLRSSAILGVVLGTCTGMYAAQNFDVPNIERTLKDYFQSLKKGPK